MANGNLPIFAAGSEANIQSNIDSGVLSYPAYVVDPTQRKLFFISKTNDIIPLDFGLKDDVKFVDSVENLPTGEDIEKDVIYVTPDGMYYAITTTDEETSEETTKLVNIMDSALEGSETLTEITSKLEELEGQISDNAELVFSDYDSFPAEGEEGKLYIDKDGGFYKYDVENAVYVKIITNDDRLQFIELEDASDDTSEEEEDPGVTS